MPAASILIYSPVPGPHCADDNQRQEGLGSFGGERERTLLVTSRTGVHGFTPVGLFGIASAHVVLVAPTRAEEIHASSRSRFWVVGAVAGRARPPMERQIRRSDEMQSATLYPTPCCLLEGCIRLAWRSIGDGFPVADAEMNDGGGTGCEGASTLSACKYVGSDVCVSCAFIILCYLSRIATIYLQDTRRSSS